MYIKLTDETPDVPASEIDRYSGVVEIEGTSFRVMMIDDRIELASHAHSYQRMFGLVRRLREHYPEQRPATKSGEGSA